MNKSLTVTKSSTKSSLNFYILLIFKLSEVNMFKEGWNNYLFTSIRILAEAVWSMHSLMLMPSRGAMMRVHKLGRTVHFSVACKKQ